MIYLDASAIVTHLTRRSHHEALDHYLSGFPRTELITSTIGLIETVRVCDSLGTFPNLMAHLRRDYGELTVTGEIRDRAAHLPGGLRTLDAIHVASAEILEDALIALVTYDRRMAEVARARGLPVSSPGAAG